MWCSAVHVAGPARTLLAIWLLLLGCFDSCSWKAVLLHISRPAVKIRSCAKLLSRVNSRTRNGRLSFRRRACVASDKELLEDEDDDELLSLSGFFALASLFSAFSFCFCCFFSFFLVEEMQAWNTSCSLELRFGRFLRFLFEKLLL